MITLTMSAVTGSGLDKTILAPVIENKIMEGRKVLVIFPVPELQKQFESFFADRPVEPVVTTIWRVTNRAFGIGDADLVILHSLHGNIAEQIIKANTGAEFWVINPMIGGSVK